MSVAIGQAAVVVLGSRSWGWEHPLGDLQLARAFAKLDHRVLFVEPASASGTGAARALVTPDGASVQVVRPWQPTGRLPQAAPALRGRMIARQVRRGLDALGWRAALTIVVRPEQLAWRYLGDSRVLYWQKDRQWAAPTTQGRLTQRSHARLLARADVVTAVSPVIAEDNAALGRAAAVVENAVDVAHFSRPAAEPAELAGVPRPRVIFAGALGWRVATDQLVALALRAPDLQLVLVGASRAPALLRSMPNVHIIGSRPYDSLPDYLQACDVGLIPYVPNAFNTASCPLKFYEYTAAGLPVVVSGVPLPRGLPAGVAHVTEARAADLLSGVRAALASGRHGPPDSAAGLDWTDRVQSLLALAGHDRRHPMPVEV